MKSNIKHLTLLSCLALMLAVAACKKEDVTSTLSPDVPTYIKVKGTKILDFRDSIVGKYAGTRTDFSSNPLGSTSHDSPDTIVIQKYAARDSMICIQGADTFSFSYLYNGTYDFVSGSQSPCVNRINISKIGSTWNLEWDKACQFVSNGSGFYVIGHKIQ